MGFIEPGRAVKRKRKVRGGKKKIEQRIIKKIDTQLLRGSILERFPLEILHEIFVLTDLENLPLVSRYFSNALACDSYLSLRVMNNFIHKVKQQTNGQVVVRRVLELRVLNYKFVTAELLRSIDFDMILPVDEALTGVDGHFHTNQVKPEIYDLPESFHQIPLSTRKLDIIDYLTETTNNIRMSDIDVVAAECCKSDMSNELCETTVRRLFKNCPLQKLAIRPFFSAVVENRPNVAQALLDMIDTSDEVMSSDLWDHAVQNESSEMAHFLLENKIPIPPQCMKMVSRYQFLDL